ncbi:COG4626 Phage terminase-like protein, large subunit [uncultured Caudovirales phage]|uniref:COG4626 Phage terminase-like protein, large subunit n=1 Tax=uncultured Caudovirales phage TaxID=2100421 RepID=A0A6J5ST96_9CAUD|nr:COG4626 Phage terminase-like protein, large subunit [uncultured Caudovirales phage]
MTEPKPPAKRRSKKPYYDASKALRVERFFEQFLRHTKGRWAGQPFILEPWQREQIIQPLFGTRQQDGRRQYAEGLVGLPRKSGKSELAAGIALYGLVADGESGAEIYSVAGSKQQASIVFKTAADMVRASPLLRSACKVYRSVIEFPETGSIYRALASDANLAHGYNPHMAIVDELHVHPNSELYEAMRTGTAARLEPLILSITTAGAERSGIAWDLYQRGLSKQDKKLFLYWQSAPDGCAIDDLKAWDAANPASWITHDFLRQQMPPSLPEQVFRRLHLNQWFEQGAAMNWVPRDRWEEGNTKPVFDESLPCVIGVDAASRRDTTAVCLLQRDAEGIHNARFWLFESDRQMGYLDYSVVEDLIRDLCSTYWVARLAFDPFQMVRTQQILASEGLPAETFPQNDARMVPASQNLYDIVMSGRLRHGGVEEITEQVMAAGIRETARGWRLEKKKSSAPIDAVIALAIASQLAEFESDLSSPNVMIV